VLPELADSGYLFSDVGEARSLASPTTSSVTLRDWQWLAARHDLTVAGGFCELGPDGKLYNSAAIVDASGTIAVYRKAHLSGTPRRTCSRPAVASRRSWSCHSAMSGS
jgi:5-aminopentanamidase